MSRPRGLEGFAKYIIKHVILEGVNRAHFCMLMSELCGTIENTPGPEAHISVASA